MKQFTKNTFLLICVSITCLFAVTFCANADDTTRKIISWGWNNPDTAYVRDHWQEMEQSPVQGVAVKIPISYNKPTSGDGSTGNLLGWNVFGDQQLDIKKFQQSIADLQTAHWRNFELFIPLAIASYGQDKNFNWFDDKRWNIIENNWRVMLQIAKSSGIHNIIFDTEIYDYAQYGAELFSYQEQKVERVDKPFDVYQKQARQRGQSLMRIAAQEYPDITIFAPFIYTPALTGGNSLSERRYALLPAFMDGMLETSAPQTIWVDSWEYSYGYKERSEYLEAYHDILNGQLSLCAVPDIFRAKVRVAFNLFIDNTYHHAAWNETDYQSNYFSPISFQQSLEQALEVSDKYVFIYSQKPGFFPEQQLPIAYKEAIKNALAKANSHSD